MIAALLVSVVGVVLVQPKILPLNSDPTWEKLAQSFVAKKKESTISRFDSCLTLDEVVLNIKERMLLAFGQVGKGVQEESIGTIALKIYQCHVLEFGGVGMNYRSDSIASYFHPLTVSFSKTTRNISGEIDTSARAIVWAGEYLMNNDSEVLRRELVSSCNMLEAIEPQNFAELCSLYR